MRKRKYVKQSPIMLQHPAPMAASAWSPRIAGNEIMPDWYFTDRTIGPSSHHWLGETVSSDSFPAVQAVQELDAKTT
jgi:hypothetical protein